MTTYFFSYGCKEFLFYSFLPKGDLIDGDYANLSGFML